MAGIGDLKRKDVSFIAGIVLVVYFAVVFWLLFVNIGSTDRQSYFTKREAHTIPFQYTFQTLYKIASGNFGAENKWGYTYLAFRNILGNLILFAPLGFLAPIVFPVIRQLWQVILLTFFISLGAESIQYVFKRGVFDIDDVIFNSIGAAVGFTLLKMSARYFSRPRMQPC